MAELADALDSGSSESNFMEVQVLLPAPKSLVNTAFSRLFAFSFRCHTAVGGWITYGGASACFQSAAKAFAVMP